MAISEVWSKADGLTLERCVGVTQAALERQRERAMLPGVKEALEAEISFLKELKVKVSRLITK